MAHCKSRSFTLVACFILVLFISMELHSCNAGKVPPRRTKKCRPRNEKPLFRLGKTRFWVRDEGKNHKITKPTKVDGYKHLKANWNQGRKKCEQYNADLRMARDLNKITTNALIAKGLEEAADRLNLFHTVYWIDGQFDKYINSYIWGDNKNDLVTYGNFYYSQPRPMGWGSNMGAENAAKLFGSKEMYNKTSGTPQCLTFELPYKNLPDYGWQASWNERSCDGHTHRRVLCESTNPACEENKSRDPHVLTEDKEYYFTEGNWIFANRRFVVNWKPRQYAEAKAYCEQHKMEIFSPVPADECLIPYLKLWAPVLSTYNFWTTYKYQDKDQVFKDKHNKTIQRGASFRHDYSMRSGRTDNVPDEFCVVFQWTYEFKNETRCNAIGCDWMYYILAPSNCQNFVGTVCQHTTEDNTRVCDFSREWLSNHQYAIDSTAVVEFGYKGSGFWRSTYKQTFGSKICGDKDRQMIDTATEYWKVDPNAVDFTYDYEETYWVVDDQLFENVGKDEELCSVSIVASTPDRKVYIRQLQKVNCNEWHFYLCESVM